MLTSSYPTVGPISALVEVRLNKLHSKFFRFSYLNVYECTNQSYQPGKGIQHALQTLRVTTIPLQCRENIVT